MSYVYKITNLINGKIYIGKTDISIEKRYTQHKSASRNGLKYPLYNAMRKYGEKNFQVELVEEELTPEEACEREIYWIDKLRTYIGFEDCNGYNATLGGEGTLKYNYQEIANKYLELGTVYKTAEFFGCDKTVVQNACLTYNVKIEKNGIKNYTYEEIGKKYLELKTIKDTASFFL